MLAMLLKNICLFIAGNCTDRVYKLSNGGEESERGGGGGGGGGRTMYFLVFMIRVDT